MPELPEVETIVRELRPLVVGSTILRATLSHTNVLEGVTKPALLRGLAGACIEAMSRRAKHAIFHLDGDRRFIVQPGMSGALLVHPAHPEGDAARYNVLRAELADGRWLVYRDVRRLGNLLLLDAEGWAAYDARLGPEPLDPALTADRFGEPFRRSRQAVKKVLMDQRAVVGVGNIYANEALFAAGIDPSKPARLLGSAQIERLFTEVQRILRAAIGSRGTTFRDYRTGTGEFGAFQLELFVYGREGEPCRVCGRRLAVTHEIDARSTVFCWDCQR